MEKHCPENERIKREYLKFLKHARRRSEASLDMAAKAIDRFEAYARHRNFKEFRRQQAIGFCEHLAEQKNERNGNVLSRGTRHATLAALRSFFQWLAREPGYKSRIPYHDADYFSLSERDGRIARTRLAKAYPLLEQVQAVIRAMPTGNAVQLRDRAVVAFILLTGARDGAVFTFKLKHLDVARGVLHQDAREVATKLGKSFDTFFSPSGMASGRSSRTGSCTFNRSTDSAPMTCSSPLPGRSWGRTDCCVRGSVARRLGHGRPDPANIQGRVHGSRLAVPFAAPDSRHPGGAQQ